MKRREFITLLRFVRIDRRDPWLDPAVGDQ
jgi:hypothetical protein